jgi:asparagine synthase (glutamine-hydrolysing)
MCGVTALADREGDTGRDLERMTSVLLHRGPDDGGVWQSPDGTLSLGHRRLSIVDLSAAGHNPMSWRDGRYWITYNGEVYNFHALRATLERSGARFMSQTDTEVILAAYEQWGTSCFARFNGMFALAIWDTATRRLVVARDRLGKKPLYYATYGQRFAVASELKAFAADPRFPRVVDPQAVACYLRYGYIPAPLTIYEHARKLEPGYFATIDQGVVQKQRYWDPLAAQIDPPRTPGEAEAQLEQLLADAVALRTIADVPVGAFLSGGIDSSLIVALMQEQARTAVKTFTIRFEDPEYDESEHAAAVARHLRTDHYEELCTERDMLEIAQMLADIFDEPFGDSSAVPTYLVARAARQRVTVALSGDGGDELFFGYPRYRHHMQSRWLLDAPRPLRRAMATAASVVPRRRFQRIAEVLRLDSDDQYRRFVTCWDDQGVEALSHCRAQDAPAYSSARQRTARLPREMQPPLLDLVTYLPDDILTKVDRASMRVSLEARCPLLDYRVVEFAIRLPLDLKWRNGRSKWILRQLLEKRVPRALVDRPKMGFGVPIARWLRGPLHATADRLFRGGESLSAVGVDVHYARARWHQFLGGRDDMATRIWNLFVLARWSERWTPCLKQAASA